ncbi:hypothetical protein [Polaromonas sp.]|uniref:hypothetical protein n=1 Tax=Polaromonas sp. TaxID=1869339 RepID=UPI00273154DB|nr:hypothetical protein [Polaromonas sp.]MDP1740971.1 hypothetical protein [Polaromonas sp.]
MTLSPQTLEVRLEGSAYGLSARRLWEHTESGQINVFQLAISTEPSRNDPAKFVDVAWMYATGLSLLGCTLHDWKNGRDAVYAEANGEPPDRGQLRSPEVIAFLKAVAKHLEVVAERRATRDQHGDFFPAATAKDTFGSPFVFSTLQRLLQDMGKTAADGKQWEGTVRNLENRGLRSDELRRSGLLHYLEALKQSGKKVTAQQMLDACDFSSARLSVIPVVGYAQRQLNFVPATEHRFKRAAKAPKPQAGQERHVVEFDPVLGYRIEEVEHQTLWGTERHWLAISHDGRTLPDSQNKALFETPYWAALASKKDAKKRFPKRVALGRWNDHAWTGGQDYREWLVTLPYYPNSFFSTHFSIRNVLAHIRCDIRDGPDDEKVLMLHEVQSDWAKSTRDAIDMLEADPAHEQFPPLWREWSSLTMKLVLLHAAYQGVDAVGWTKGVHQVRRYEGFGAKGLKQLYDQILPREVNRLVKPFGIACVELGVFVPENFSIKQSESGYEVRASTLRRASLLGTAATLEEARRFVPDGGHEILYEVHGVRLSAETRQIMLKTGFPVWG